MSNNDIAHINSCLLYTSQPKFAENVFVAGDAAHGASLVVRALADGRRVATEIDRYLEPLKENKK